MWMGVVSCWRVREYSIHDGWLRVVKISCACKLFVGGIGFTEGAPESLSSLRRQQGRPAQASMHTTCIMEGLLSCRRSLKSVQRRGPDVCQDGVGLGGSVSIQHSHLTLAVAQQLEIARAKGLCPENVPAFQQQPHGDVGKHNYYPLAKIWNANESSPQASCNSGALVLASTHH